MPDLILGPLLRYVGPGDATVWVETGSPCTVEVLGHTQHTFKVEDHHYAIVLITDLEPDSAHEYTVRLNGKKVWPESGSGFPPSLIRTPDPDKPFKLNFGSCRVAVPHKPPFTLTKGQDNRGHEVDALFALSHRMQDEKPENWPDALLLLGDQIYADKISPETRRFIHTRRDVSEPPGEELADFEEYTYLYRDSWSEPDIRWLLSTVPTAMIFDDHEVIDDWNISGSWVRDMRAIKWWDEKIVAALMSYWIYQHIGNLSPRELYEDKLYQKIYDYDDAGNILREFAFKADRDVESYRWSFYRDFGETRLIVMDSRAGRVLHEGIRDMMDEKEWKWVEQHCRGDFEHLLLGTSLPVLVSPGIHYLQAWNEAVCSGAWGNWWENIGEWIRRKLDLEHWGSFRRAFRRITDLMKNVGTGKCGNPPSTLVLLSGDIHNAFLAKASLPINHNVKTKIYQAVCSPLRNPLGPVERVFMKFSWTSVCKWVTKAFALAAGAEEPEINWNLTHKYPWFTNQIATLELEKKKALFRIERTTPQDHENPVLETVYEYRLDKNE